jgi:hypothetical protein
MHYEKANLLNIGLIEPDWRTVWLPKWDAFLNKRCTQDAPSLWAWTMLLLMHMDHWMLGVSNFYIHLLGISHEPLQDIRMQLHVTQVSFQKLNPCNFLISPQMEMHNSLSVKKSPVVQLSLLCWGSIVGLPRALCHAVQGGEGSTPEPARHIWYKSQFTHKSSWENLLILCSVSSSQSQKQCLSHASTECLLCS